MLRSSGRREPAPLQRHRLLAAHDGTGSVHGSHAQVGAVLILEHHVPDAAEGSGCSCNAAIYFEVYTQRKESKDGKKYL